MAEEGGNGGSGVVIDRPGDEGASMEPKIDDQTAATTTENQGVVVAGGGDGGEGREQEVGNEEKGHATEENPRATVLPGAVGSIREAEGLGTVAEGSPIVGGSSGGVGGSGAAGDDPGPNGSPPRDPARGESAVIAEEEEPTEIPVEYMEQDIAFRPAASAATSSRHAPVTKQDIAEHLPDDRLAKLLEENPDVVEIVLKAKEERARAIAAWEAEGAAQRDIRGFGGACRSLVLYEALPHRVRDLVDAVGFGEFIRTLTRSRIDHAVLVALAERWKDTSNTFHLPIGEMTVTPADFAAITGLRVGEEPIPFDSGIQDDRVALEWFLGDAPKIEEGMAKYEQFTKYLKKKVTTEREAEQMARAYLLYLFGASLYPNRPSRVHLSYLPTLRDLRTASRFDWGGAALGTAYAFLGNSSRIGKSTAGYWRVWELWAYEVLRMYPAQCKHPDLSTLPHALIWSKKNMGSKEGRGSLNAYRLYLDELRASQINWNPWRVAGVEPVYLARSRAITASRVLLESAFGWQWYLGDRVSRQSLGYTAFQVPGSLLLRASHTSTYTRAELERFTLLDTELTRFLRSEMDYAEYQRDRLERPLGIRALRDVQSQARGAAEERRAAGERARGGEGRVRIHAGVPLDDTELSWQVPNEWVNKAIRRMLALENLVRRAAGGFPLELRYPAPSPPQGQRAVAKKPQVYNDTFLLSILNDALLLSIHML
ncbi:hypothetical protein RHMOL_Rhmol07G0158200 [Rhododendron molle]|uniref:Uncharacterized protein n=1 Tax=Rhododendron molle TaxID=49168 RepID=A0ACC0N249_RHOML|nr:hypothetical protein RHMOL_Rhmol07G0158200 [Rhododendron molle]